MRYLNAVGGGVITRIDGRIAYVDDGGFENPVLVSELVVVLPAGHQPAQSGAKLMFDQAAFDAGRKSEPAAPAPAAQASKPAAPAVAAPETSYGDRLNLALAFEPADLKRLSETTFNAVLVNDSNYWLAFSFLRRSAAERAWTLEFQGEIGPNELIDLASYSHMDLLSIERVAVQAVAFKKKGDFELQSPVSVERRLDLTKFHKLHCFRPGLYFDTPVIEVPLMKDGRCVGAPEPPKQSAPVDAQENQARRLAEKFNVDAPRKGKKQAAPSPTKLLPLIEIDLHAAELLETTAGMSAADILGYQLDTVRGAMREHSRRKGQKIVFIHGKGDGVLRKKTLELLRREFPKAELQDASFQEYGFGATLVTIH